MFQASIAYDNPETRETMILFLNEAICMGETMYHTLVNPNQFCAYGMTVQDKPFAESPIFISTEDHDCILPLSSKGNIFGFNAKTLTDK